MSTTKKNEKLEESIVTMSDNFKIAPFENPNGSSITAFNLTPKPTNVELSSSELSQSHNQSQSRMNKSFLNPITEEYSNPYIKKSTSNFGASNPSGIKDNKNNSNGYNQSDMQVSNFNKSVEKFDVGKKKEDSGNDYLPVSNSNGVTVDKDGKVRDHTKLIKSMNRYKSIKTPFELCKKQD